MNDGLSRFVRVRADEIRVNDTVEWCGRALSIIRTDDERADGRGTKRLGVRFIGCLADKRVVYPHYWIDEIVRREVRP